MKISNLSRAMLHLSLICAMTSVLNGCIINIEPYQPLPNYDYSGLGNNAVTGVEDETNTDLADSGNWSKPNDFQDKDNKKLLKPRAQTDGYSRQKKRIEKFCQSGGGTMIFGPSEGCVFKKQSSVK